MNYVVGRTQTKTLSRLPLNLTSADFQLFGFFVINPVFLTVCSPFCNIEIQTHCFKNSMGTGKMAQQLRTPAAHTKDPGSISFTQMTAQNHLFLHSQRDLKPSSVLQRYCKAMVHTDIYAGKTPTNKKLIRYKILQKNIQ